MKTLITQPLSAARRQGWRMLPALLVALCSFCALSVNAQVWTIGTGTSQFSSTSSGPASPLGYYYSTQHQQYIYTAAELTAAGMTAGTIHQIAFNVGTTNSAPPAPAYSLGLGLTTLSTFTSTTAFQPTTTVLSSPGGITPVTGWNLMNITTFTWDGTSNIVLEVCHSTLTAVNGPAEAGVYYSSVTNSGLGRAITTNQNYCSQSAGIIGASVTSNRPNIRFYRLSPCGGTPTAGTITPTGVVSTLCPGSRVTLSVSGATNALAINTEWMVSTNGTTWSAITGASNQLSYLTPPLVSTTYYHLRITCLNSGLKDSTANVQFTFPGGFPVYASLPYYEGFENWSNGCSTNDKLSSNNWTNSPTTGNSSWRRDDDGGTAAWTSPTTPIASLFKEGVHSARWHGVYAPAGPAGEGALSLYVNTGTTTGAKDMSFWFNFHYNTTSPQYPGDSLNVDMSTDGGATFVPLGQYGWGTVPQATWNKVLISNIAVSSATTVFRFRAKDLNSGYDDIFLDGVTINPPCAAKPFAGIIDTVVACSGAPFTLTTHSTSAAAGLAYQWQYKPFGAAFWSPLPGGNVPNPSTSMTVNTMYRVIVSCTNTTPVLSDTSAVYAATIAPFYYCYCSATVAPAYAAYNYVECGNVTMKTLPAGVVILNNGVGLPSSYNPLANQKGYEDFRLKVSPPTMVRDSSYRLFASEIGYNFFETGCYGAAWIDWNRDGLFNNATERVMQKPIPSATNNTCSDSIHVPASAPVGLTGMRVLVQYYTPINPCNYTIYYGQYEDYLVKIEYTPCSGPVNPGTAYVSDSSVCPGYTVDLTDTTYEKQHTNIIRYWQVSTNGGASYAVIPGSGQTDVLTNVIVTATSKYRLMAICGPTGDTTYSNAVSVTSPSPVHCYPVSTSALGAKDSSDIGTFIIGNFINPAPGNPAGPHLLNPAARMRHSDFTKLTPIELYADSTYRLAVFQTMPGANHADALVSVFIDYNNNLNYDVAAPPPPSPYTSELVFQSRTRYDSFFLDTKFTVPSAVIPNVLTGLRVVLNNDMTMVPSNPALSGSGLFTSGEVEDYIVIFRRPGLSAGSSTLLQNLSLYPNPTGGKFTVLSDASRAVSHMEVLVTTITGQQILSRSFDNVGAHFTTSIDLSNEAKGIYFVELRADGEKVTRKLILR